MTVVVEVGPAAVRGPAACRRDTVRAALTAVDDELTVLGDDVVEVRALWREVLATAVGDADSAIVVCPGWWPPARTAMIDRAAADVFVEHVVLQRSALLADDDTAVLEVADDLLVWTPPGCPPEVLSRERADLAARLGGVAAVLIDLPPGTAPVPDNVLAAVRRTGVSISWVSRARVDAAALAVWRDTGPPSDGPWWRRRARAIGVGGAAAACVLAATVSAMASPPPMVSQPMASTTVASTTVTEGRMAISVPTDWRVQRLTDGPGSDRLRVTAPDDSVSLHLTHSVGAAATTLADVAESLRRAMRPAASGVFSEPDPLGAVGGRPAVTYQEQRTDATTTWAVVVDGDVRIAVGCQVRRPSAGADDACASAVRSAHALP